RLMDSSTNRLLNEVQQRGLHAGAALPLAEPVLKESVADRLGRLVIKLGGQDLLDLEDVKALRRLERTDDITGTGAEDSGLDRRAELLALDHAERAARRGRRTVERVLARQGGEIGAILGDLRQQLRSDPFAADHDLRQPSPVELRAVLGKV